MPSPLEVLAAARNWGSSRFDSLTATAVQDFFERAFRLARCPDEAWFGVHPGRLSLVVGGLWLAAVNAEGRDGGVWLLTDGSGPSIDGVKTWKVKSFKHIENPLHWTRGPIEALPRLLAEPGVWDAYARATERAHEAGSGRGRADLNQRRGKVRLADILVVFDDDGWRLPNEVLPADVYREGAVRQVTVNAHERSPEARRKCIAHQGPACVVCRFDFGSVYGHHGPPLIHVHHLNPISRSEEQREVDPVADLLPVCPNCHAMIHAKDPLYTIEEVRRMLAGALSAPS